MATFVFFLASFVHHALTIPYDAQCREKVALLRVNNADPHPSALRVNYLGRLSLNLLKTCLSFVLS